MIAGTNLATTSGTNVAIGEEVQYQVTLTIPDGVSANAVLTDTLPTGLAIVAVNSIAASSALSTSVSGGFSAVASSATVGNSGGTLSLNFGTITNSNRDATQTQTIVVTYTAIVLNVASNAAGKVLSNSAVFAVQGGSTSAATPVTVVEPHVGVTVTPSTTKGDANGPAITFTVVVAATAGTGADAYDTALTDVLPAGFTYVAGSLTDAAGTAPTSQSDTAGQINATYADLAPGATSTLTFRATLNSTITPAQVVTDAASLTYTSLPGVATTPESTYNTSSTERTGKTTGPGGSANTYAANSSTSVTVNANTITGAVFDDRNDDGAIGAGEPGLAGAVVTLTGVDNLGNAVNQSVTTTATGAYSFTLLRPGSYNLAMTPPTGYLDGKDTVGTPFGGTVPAADHFAGLTIPLGTNAAGAGYNFAELRPASVAGKVFADLNNNGAVDGGEPGIAGVSLTLTGTDDLGHAVNTTLTTDSGGNFAFANLRPGTYAVAETQPGGYLQGKNAAGTSGGTFTVDTLANVVLVEGQAATGVTYGELPPATLAGTVYVDANDDGVKQAGESGVGNVAVTLTGTDDLGHAVNTTVSTTGGAYSFAGLRPGTYAVGAATPSGFVAGKGAAGTLGGTVLARDQVASIPVAAGNAGTGYNLGLLPPSNLAGSVYVDANNDGTRGSGEAGVGSATVTLIGTDDLGHAVTLTATSAADGTYSFSGLRPGTYALAETPPAGELDSHANPGTRGGTAAGPRSITGITLGANQAAAGDNFGVLDPAAIGGSVYVDVNDDGTRQVSESGVGGLTMTLTGTDDLGYSVATTATTAGDGSFTFLGLRPGTYAVIESAPAGYYDGRVTPGPVGGTAGSRQVTGITLTPGLGAGGNLFAALQPSSLAGVVYLDRNDDGTQETGEAGLDGVVVALTGTDDLGASVSRTTTTAGGGLYSFAGLRPGSYTLNETPPAGTLAGTDAAGSLGGTVGGDSIAVVVAEGNAGTGSQFARLAPSSVAGVVYHDGNDDGIQEAGDAGLAGATLLLTGTDDHGQAVSTAVATNPDGSYAFADLRPGTYAVSINPPAGYLDGVETPGSAGGSTGPRRIAGIALASGTGATGYAFAELAPSSLAGVAFNDANDDGIQEAGEGGLAGVTITLTGTDDRGANVAQSTTTASDGTYQLTALRPGTYALTAASPLGTLDGQARAGTQGGTAGGRTIAGIGLGQGVAGTANDFASLAPASLAGSVYLDRNADGLLEAGEPGIAGVTVTLTGTDDLGHSVSTAQVTAADGSYRFAALRPETYTITETPPAGDFDGKVAAGSAGGTVGTHQVAAISLVPGTGGTGTTFGQIPAARLAGVVFDDASDDGTQNSGEAGFGGVVLTLTGTDTTGQTVTETTTTAPDGSYSFDDLRPGTYGLLAAPPAGYLIGKTSGAGCSCSCPDGLATIPVVAGDSLSNEQIGMVRPASLAGSVYFDANGDATRQAGEPGQGGITITLDGTDDLGAAVSRTTTTDAAGNYAFAGLRPGRYALADLRPTTYAGESATAGTVGGTAGTDVILGVAPGSGAAGLGYDFALVGATVAGRVAVVAGTGGVGVGVGGVTITLANPAGVPLATITTASDGSYQFADLPTGPYLLGLATPAGYAPATATLRAVGVPLGGIGGQDFGLAAASIAGAVFADANDDGIQQAGEAGLADVVVTLTGRDSAGRAVQATTRTLGGGSYAFLGLAAGTYSVAEAAVTGYLDGRSAPGNLGGTAGLDQVTAILVGSGTVGVAYNFGKLLPARIAGDAFLDLNHDGIQQAGEAGIGGVAVTLTGTDAFGDAVDRALTTGPDGSYAFENLLPGTYAVLDTAPAGFAPGPASVNGGPSGPIALATGGSATADFAAEGSDLGGLVLNAQGDQAAPDAQVQLLDAAGQVVATTTTGADGRYQFSGLVAGTYTVQVDRPNADGTVTTVSQTQNLIPGADAESSFTTVLTPPATGQVAGTVFLDRNDDGVQSSGEAGLGGQVVTLTGTDATGRAVALTTATDADGRYAFAGLRPGVYAVAHGGTVSALADGPSNVGSLGGVAAGSRVGQVALLGGDLGLDYNFALRP